MIGKLGLAGAVVLAWVLTFAVMGGDVIPGFNEDAPAKVSGQATPWALSHPDAVPLTPSESPTQSPAGSPTGSPSAEPTAETEAKDASKATPAASAPTSAGDAARAVAGTLLTQRPGPRREAPRILDFRISSFNMLGSSHTTSKGKNPRRASGPARTARAASYITAAGISVVGFQELQPNQRSTFLSATGGRWGLYPGNAGGLDGDNSIAWRLDTWEMVKPGSRPIPYFGGRPRNMPVILLRNKQTGITAYFTNFHNPANTKQYGNQDRWRAAAKARQVELFRELKDDGYPVFVTGDMNETQSWFCAVAGPGDLKAAAGGDGGRNGCSVAGGYRVDWIAGSHDVQFSNYREDKSGTVKWMTDHPVMITDVRIDSSLFPDSVLDEGEEPR